MFNMQGSWLKILVASVLVSKTGLDIFGIYMFALLKLQEEQQLCTIPLKNLLNFKAPLHLIATCALYIANNA